MEYKMNLFLFYNLSIILLTIVRNVFCFGIFYCKEKEINNSIIYS